MYGKGKVELLSDRTFREFNIDVAKLQPNSNHKVWVKCSYCGEEFLRPFCKLYQLHACPTHIINGNGLKLKWCSKCKQFLSYQKFNANNAGYDGLSSICATCKLSSKSAKKHDYKNMVRRKLDFDYWLRCFVSAKKSKCKRDHVQCEVNIDLLKELWDNQEGRCFYSRIRMAFGNNSLRSASLERLDSSRGYVANNVVWASKAMNYMKNSAPYSEFCEFLEHACFTRHTPVRVECVLVHPDAKLPFRKRVTDAGHDLYAVEDVVIGPRMVVDVRTGIKLSTPPGYYYTIEGRSSMWQKGVMPFSAIIDATYTGEVMTALLNLTDTPIEIKKHDRVAQIVIQKIHDCDLVVVDNFGPDYDQRGLAGYGSSGR